FAWTPAHGLGAAAYPVDDNAGKRIGYFIWRPYRPGTAVLSRAMPILGGLLALALLTVAGFLAVVRSRSLRLQASEVRIHHLAFHDPLTGLPNRTFFNESADAALAAAWAEVFADRPNGGVAAVPATAGTILQPWNV
ncbi:MAG: hypothetical protein ACP5NI_09830, partial [Acetobacteraceae bacterium]